MSKSYEQKYSELALQSAIEERAEKDRRETAKGPTDTGILPCRFCGNSDIEITFCDDRCCGGDPRWIDCHVCGYTLSVDDCSTKEQAVKAWNRRSQN